MPFDRQNDYFYKDFTGGDGNNYQLRFYPAFDGVSTDNAIEFPDDVIINNCKVGAEFPDNLPYSLNQARSLEISIDLYGLTEGDWSDVADWIIQGKVSDYTLPSGSYVKSDTDIPLYNRWELYDSTNSEWVFSGFQSPNEDREIELKKDFLEYKLTVIGAEKVIYEYVPLDNIVTPSTTTYTDYNPDIIYYDSINTQYMSFAQDKNRDIKFCTWNALQTQIGRYAEEVTKKMYKKSSTSISLNIDLTTCWSFYKQDVEGDETNPRLNTTALTDTQIGVCAELLDGSDVVGGLFSNNDNLSLANYNNAWSFFRALSDSFLLKMVTSYNGFGEPNLAVYKPFDAVDTNQDIEGMDQADFSIKLSPKLINTSSVYVLGSGSRDTSDIKQSVSGGSIDGASEEVEMAFHNYATNYDLNSVKLTDGGPKRKAENFNARTLYYDDDIFGATVDAACKVHEHCTYDLGDSNTFESDTTYLTFTYPEGRSFKVHTLDFYNAYPNRLTYSGVGRERNRAVNFILGNSNHAIIDVTLANQVNTSSIISPNKIGETYTVDLSSLSNLGSIAQLSTKAILTGVDYDFIEGSGDCMFFLRGA